MYSLKPKHNYFGLLWNKSTARATLMTFDLDSDLTLQHGGFYERRRWSWRCNCLYYDIRYTTLLNLCDELSECSTKRKQSVGEFAHAY